MRLGGLLWRCVRSEFGLGAVTIPESGAFDCRTELAGLVGILYNLLRLARRAAMAQAFGPRRTQFPPRGSSK